MRYGLSGSTSTLSDSSLSACDCGDRTRVLEGRLTSIVQGDQSSKWYSLRAMKMRYLRPPLIYDRPPRMGVEGQRYEHDHITAAATKPPRDRELYWYLSTQLSLRPRTLELNEFIMRKADGWRTKNRPSSTEADWHIELASALFALNGSHVDLAFELFMRRQGEIGIKRMNQIYLGRVAPNANWYERFLKWLGRGLPDWVGLVDYAEMCRLKRADQIVPTTI